MNSREFCYWLQGYFEIVSASSNQEPEGLTSGQVEMIQKHLNMVFFHEIDPSYPADQQDQLNKLHNNGKSIVAASPPLQSVMRC